VLKDAIISGTQVQVYHVQWNYLKHNTQALTRYRIYVHN